MPSADGKMRGTEAADLETMLRIIQSVPSPKAEPVKQWLARAGARSVEEAARPVLPNTAGARPMKPVPDAPAVAWAEYYEAMATLYRRTIAIETTLAAHDAQIGELFSRLEGVEEVAGHLLPNSSSAWARRPSRSSIRARCNRPRSASAS